MKKALTLLELLLSLSLFAIILAFFFTSFHLQQKKRVLVQATKENVLEKKYLQSRLEKFFSTVQNDALTIGEHWVFFVENSSLFFTFDNGIFTHPKLSSYVHAVIWLDKKEKILMCALTPLKDDFEDITYTFPLLDKVDDCAFSFFSSETCSWQSNWENTQELPAFLKIAFVREQKTDELLFDLKKSLQIKR